MSYIAIRELKTHLYGETVETIGREDKAVLQFAIDAAIAEAEGYLSNYDTGAIFSTDVPEEEPGEGEPEFEDDRNPILVLYIKDIAVWHFIQLANPNVNLELRADRYEKAIDWLSRVQSGKIVPELPLPDPGTGEQNNFIKWGSNPPRDNYF